MPPREHGQTVLVLADQLLDVRPHALGLTLQQDDDGGVLTQLQQVQEALSETTQHHSHTGPVEGGREGGRGKHSLT